MDEFMDKYGDRNHKYAACFDRSLFKFMLLQVTATVIHVNLTSIPKMSYKDNDIRRRRSTGTDDHGMSASKSADDCYTKQYSTTKEGRRLSGEVGRSVSCDAPRESPLPSKRGVVNDDAEDTNSNIVKRDAKKSAGKSNHNSSSSKNDINTYSDRANIDSNESALVDSVTTSEPASKRRKKGASISSSEKSPLDVSSQVARRGSTSSSINSELDENFRSPKSRSSSASITATTTIEAYNNNDTRSISRRSSNSSSRRSSSMNYDSALHDESNENSSSKTSQKSIATAYLSVLSSEAYAYNYTDDNAIAAKNNALYCKVLDYLDIVQCDNYRSAFLTVGLDEVKLQDVCMDNKSLDTFLSAEIGVQDESHRQLLRTMLQSINDNSCLHLCVEKWNDENKIGRFICNQCFKYFSYDDGKAGNLDHYENLQDVAREAREQEIESRIIQDPIPLDLSKEQRKEYIGELSQNRGVPIDWLIDFTNKNDCWDMTTQEVCRRFVFPATAARRCRYVELGHMAGITGPASTFISHCRGGTWGDLVAAVGEGDADRSRRVWIDIFACRQWPSLRPDLDFDATIRHCSSFLVVCSSLKELVKVDFHKTSSMQASDLLSKHVRSKIAFLRVWCLVEIYTASQCRNLPIIMKGGNFKREMSSSGLTIKFEHNREMLRKMSYMIDISNAEATVPEDKEAILDMIRGEDAKGLENLNSKVRGIIISSCFSASGKDKHGDKNAFILQNAACGDSRPLALVNASPLEYLEAICVGGFSNLLESCILQSHAEELKEWPRLVEALMKACLGGHIDIARKLIELGADVNAQREDGWTSLMRACFGGHTNIAILLIDNRADVNAKKKDERTSLKYACQGGHTDIVRLLVSRGAEVNDKDKATPLEYACQGGYIDIAKFLIESGADVNSKNASGDTAIMKASEGGFLDIIKLLVESGADAHARNKDRKHALGYAKKNGHGDCVEYLNDVPKLDPAILEAMTSVDGNSMNITSFIAPISINSSSRINSSNSSNMGTPRDPDFQFLEDSYTPSTSTRTSSENWRSDVHVNAITDVCAMEEEEEEHEIKCSSFYSVQPSLFENSFQVLLKPVNAIDSIAFSAKLREIGLSRHNQLSYLEEAEVKELAEMLKKGAKEEFLKAWYMHRMV